MTTSFGRKGTAAERFSDREDDQAKPIGIYALALCGAAALSSATALLAALFSFSDFSDLVIFAVAAVLLGALALVNLRRPFARNQLRPVPALSATVLSFIATALASTCLLYTSPSPRDATLSRMPSSA